MPDGRDDRDAGARDRPRDELLVKGPEVLDASPAPPDDQHLSRLFGVGQIQRLRDLLGRAVALHFHRKDDELKMPAQLADHVVDGGAGRRGDEADPVRKLGDGPLARLVEQSLRRQAFLQLLEGQLQRADALGLHAQHLELVLPAAFVRRDLTQAEHLQPVGELELQMLVCAAEERAGQHQALSEPVGGALVHQAEVDVARGGVTAVGEFPFHPHGGRKLPLHQQADAADNVGDAEDLRAGGGIRPPRL